MIKKLYIYSYLLFGLVIIIFYSFCKSKDKEPPIVEITINPAAGVVGNICDIFASASDNEQVVKLEIYINNQVVQSTEDSFCSFQWNTRNHPDNSTHTIFARALDLEENQGFSDTIEVTVFNNLD
ncbi:MAG: Ig-like domain-containing protein, partial [candidate division WOR-3 bacterium]|nr:Ig-like domain-containing protein [candidate division WOR-3 bacterium]